MSSFKKDWVKDGQTDNLGAPVSTVCKICAGELYIKANKIFDKEVNENRIKTLLECDPPEFEDCIRMDKKCYEVARELDEQKKLSPAKVKLLTQKKREHMMVRMFGHQWWKKK